MPTDAELLQITMTEYLRRPEKMLRTNLRMVRELAASTGNGGLRALTDLLAQPLPGRLGELMRERLRSGYGTEVDHPPPLPPTQAPRTPFNRPITAHRRFAYTTIPLDDAKAIRREYGCTFNDVVMALCSSTLRRWLLKHDALPDEPLERRPDLRCRGMLPSGRGGRLACLGVDPDHLGLDVRWLGDQQRVEGADRPRDRIVVSLRDDGVAGRGKLGPAK
jgi:hypothetical protein